MSVVVSVFLSVIVTVFVSECNVYFCLNLFLHLLDSKRRRRRTVWEEEGECCQPGDLMPVSVVVYVFVSVCMCICV